MLDKEYKEEVQCAQKGGLMLVFVICGFIKNFLPNYYFILHVHHVKSFKMRHVRSLYFNVSLRYSLKCFKKVILFGQTWPREKYQVSKAFYIHCKVIIGRNPIEANTNTVAIQLPGNPVAYIGKCFTPY